MRSTAFAVFPLLAACSASRSIPAEQHTPTPSDASQRAEPPAAPVIAEIQFRDHILVVRAADGELRYDVKARAGGLLAGALSWRDLGQKFPAIADQFGDSIALPLDASVSPASRDAEPTGPRRR